MSERPAIVELTTTPRRSHAGKVSFIGPDDVRALWHLIPDGSQVFARSRSPYEVARILWRIGDRGFYHLVPAALWGDLPAARSVEEVWDKLGVVGYTPGQVARRLLKRWLGQLDERWPKAPPKLATWVDRAPLGGVQRIWSTSEDHAVMVDRRSAYLNILKAPLPALSPRPWAVPMRRLEGLDLDTPGILEVELWQRSQRRLLAEGTPRGMVYDQRIRWAGPVSELLGALGRGEVIPAQTEPAIGWRWDQSDALIPLVEEAGRRVSGPLWKTIYTRLWTAFHAHGGWRGLVNRGGILKVAEAEPGLHWRHWQGWPHTWWALEDASPWAMRHPQVSAWVAGGVRGEVAEAASRCADVLGVYVDAIIAKGTPPDLGDGWRVVEEGPWRAAGPGRYILGPRARHSGGGEIERETLREEAWAAVKNGKRALAVPGEEGKEGHTTDGWVMGGETSDGWPVAYWMET